MRKIMVLLTLFFVGVNLAIAQTVQVKGIVSSAEDGEPIIGASVLVEGTSIGTITDVDGKFLITNVPSSAKTLKVSYVGMKTKVVKIKSELLKIELQNDAQLLDEVVIQVAYGTAKKSSLTGAVSSVDVKQIEKRPVSSVSSVLEGTTSGVQVNNSYGEPGSDATIRIRGFASINGSNQPLYVVDGVPFGGNISDLNPQDIQNISVLKDAASSALFGSRAANGVILITTRKGRSDQSSVRFSMNQGIYNRAIKEYDKLDAREYMNVMWRGYRNSLVTNGNYATNELANPVASRNLIPSILKYNIFNQPSDDLFTADGNLRPDAMIRDGYKGDLDWFEPIERLGHRQEYNISGDGASKKSSYYFSFGYLDEKGFINTSDFQRLTGRANINLTPVEWFKTGINLSASHQNSNKTTGSADDPTLFINPFFFSRTVAPIYPVHLHDPATGDFILDKDGKKQYDGGDANKRPQFNSRHVIWENELNTDKTIRNTVNGQLFADIKFLNDFTLSLKGDLNIRNSENRVYNNAIIGDGAGSGRSMRTFYRYKNYTIQQQLNWNKLINDAHYFDVLIGHENYDYRFNYHFGFKERETLQNNIEWNNFTVLNSLDGYEDKYRTESYLSRLRYNYKDTYFAEASFRRDGSSRFAKDDRWGNFWSIGGSWMISKEKFMEPVSDEINSLKLRASYGEVGNDAGAGYYSYLPLYSIDQNANAGALYFSQENKKGLKWETTQSFGIAFDARMFNRWNLSVEYFDKRSKDLLFDISNPLSAGGTKTGSLVSLRTENIGSVSNKGFEINTDVDIIKTKDLTWNLGLNASIVKNEILSLPEQNKDGIISGTKKLVVGGSIYQFYLYQYVGVDKMDGDALYLPDTDKYYFDKPEPGKSAFPSTYRKDIAGEHYSNNPSFAKKDFSGDAIPDVYGSLNTSVTWKDLTLSALCTYSIGGEMLDFSYSSLMSATKNPAALHKDLLNSWTEADAAIVPTDPNRLIRGGIPVIDYARDKYTNVTSDRFLQDASYFTIKNISLAYQLPKTFVNKLSLKNVSVTLSVENLAIFTSLQGMSPQQSFDGINNNGYVPARVYSLGFNVKL